MIKTPYRANIGYYRRLTNKGININRKVDNNMNEITNIDNNNNLFSEYKDVLKVDDVMKMLGIGKNTVYDLLRNKKIKSIQLGKKYIIPKKCVIEFINSAS